MSTVIIQKQIQEIKIPSEHIFMLTTEAEIVNAQRTKLNIDRSSE